MHPLKNWSFIEEVVYGKVSDLGNDEIFFLFLLKIESVGFLIVRFIGSVHPSPQLYEIFEEGKNSFKKLN